MPLTSILPTITTHPHPIVEREMGPSGDQVWWRLRMTQELRDVWQMVGVANADLSRIVAHGVASNDWYWSLHGGLSVVFRHEAEAVIAANSSTTD